MPTVVTVLHVIACFFLILVVLLQAGKGGGMGLAFGGSSSGAVFGGSGAGNFLSRLTAIMAGVFMLTSVTLAYMASQTGQDALAAHSKRSRERAAAGAKIKAKFEADGKKLQQQDLVVPQPLTPTSGAPQGLTPDVVPEGAAPEGATPERAVPGESIPPKPAGAKPTGATPKPAEQPAKPAGP